MRGVLLSLATAAILLCAAPRHASAIPAHDALVSAAPIVVALQNPAKDVQVDINVHHNGGAWYRSPVWIAIGVIALVLLVILIVLLVRGGGGGTTIIRE